MQALDWDRAHMWPRGTCAGLPGMLARAGTRVSGFQWGVGWLASSEAVVGPQSTPVQCPVASYGIMRCPGSPRPGDRARQPAAALRRRFPAETPLPSGHSHCQGWP